MNSDQLDLPFREFREEPWGGRSPRALTRGHLGLIFKARAVESASAVFVDPRQFDLFDAGKRRNLRRRAAAPSAFTLLPLPAHLS